MDKLTDLAAKMRAASAQPQWHYLQSPLTSTSWDGDSFSTTAKTLIDLSAVFGVPAGAKAVYVRLEGRDSAAHGTTGLRVALGSSAVLDATECLSIFPPGGDVIEINNGVVPCDSNGDIAYYIAASGSNTMDVWLKIFGYLI